MTNTTANLSRTSQIQIQANLVFTLLLTLEMTAAKAVETSVISTNSLKTTLTWTINFLKHVQLYRRQIWKRVFSPQNESNNVFDAHHRFLIVFAVHTKIVFLRYNKRNPTISRPVLSLCKGREGMSCSLSHKAEVCRRQEIVARPSWAFCCFNLLKVHEYFRISFLHNLLIPEVKVVNYTIAVEFIMEISKLHGTYRVI